MSLKKAKDLNLNIENLNQDSTSEFVLSKSGKAHVLYQRLGNKWYAFSEIDQEVYFGSMEDTEIFNENTKTNSPKKDA